MTSKEDRIRGLYDALADSVLEASDAEILEECLESGESPEKVAEQMRDLVQRTWTDFQERLNYHPSMERANKRGTILIADSNQGLCKTLRTSLTDYGCEVIESHDKTNTRRLVQVKKPDLIIFGSRQDHVCQAVGEIEEIRKSDRRIPIIWITETHTVDWFLALRVGVSDCLKCPFSVGELIDSVERCLNLNPARTPSKTEVTASPLLGSRRVGEFIGESAAIKEVRSLIEKVAPTDSDVLITGETGTGKELVAEHIHMSSSRCQKPMLTVNSAAISNSLLETELFGYEKGVFGGPPSNQGKVRVADGGTVFFDQISDMNPYAQAMILRAIKDRILNVRIIAATNEDVEACVREGTIRKDLYYRLSVARIHLPPLRERKEDIPALLEHYLATFNHLFGQQVEGFTEELLESLLRYDWPGNIRELRNLLEAIFINVPSRVISGSDLPVQYRNMLKDETVESEELDHLMSALHAVNWNKSLAAQKLQWSRMTLYRKMAKYRLAPKTLTDHSKDEK